MGHVSIFCPFVRVVYAVAPATARYNLQPRPHHKPVIRTTGPNGLRFSSLPPWAVKIQANGL